MGWIGRAVEAIAPGFVLAREEKRARLAQLRTITNLYRAASYDRSFESWNALGTDANAEIGYQLARIRNRSRDLARNNPYIARGYGVLAAKMVGKGVRPRLALATPAQLRTRTLAAWEEWVDRCDPDAQQDLYGLQLLAVRTMIESGEALIQFVPAPELRIPWQIRILEPDLVDMSRHEVLRNGGRIVNGVEFNAAGQRVAYHMFDEHPGGDVTFGTSWGTRRVRAEFIAPLYRQERPDQVHGVPWIAPIAPLAQHLDDLMEAALKKEKIQACFAAFVRTPNRNIARSEAGITSFPGITRSEQLAPAMIDYLNDSEEITFANPPAATNSESYHRMVLHAIASGLGVTYAQMTGDLADANYSSSRVGGLDQWSLLDQWQHLVIKPMLLAPIWGMFETINAARTGRRELLRVEWDFPARELLDPGKDGAAKDDALASGRSTFTQMIQESGRDPRAHIEELIREREQFEEAGLTFSWMAEQAPPVPPPAPTPTEPDDSNEEEESEEDEPPPNRNGAGQRANARALSGRILNYASEPPAAG